MQIIEVTDLGVRSAVIRLRRRESPMVFVVYPMIHMAKASFYAEVGKRLTTAAVIVAEGIGGEVRERSVLLNAMTLSYRVLRFNRRAQLVEQRIDRPAGVPIVYPDVSLGDFKAGWRRVPVLQRLQTWLVLPFIVLARLFGGTRTVWERSATEQYDLPSPEEEKFAYQYPKWNAAFAGERDERVLAALYRLHDERHTEDVEVAVVYGAGHVPAIVQGLWDRYDYRPRSGEWLTVADI
jgi:hypothetical protein